MAAIITRTTLFVVVCRILYARNLSSRNGRFGWIYIVRRSLSCVLSWLGDSRV